MTDKEFEEYLLRMEAYKEEILSNPDKIKEFLIRAGILTKSGKVRKRYKPLKV